jgi:hypothetical protein
MLKTEGFLNPIGLSMEIKENVVSKRTKGKKKRRFF